MERAKEREKEKEKTKAPRVAKISARCSQRLRPGQGRGVQSQPKGFHLDSSTNHMVVSENVLYPKSIHFARENPDSPVDS